MKPTTKPSQPKQKRSRETLARLLKAAEKLLESEVFEEMTVQQIARKARCSVGAFYGRLENKEALLPHLLRRHYDQMEKEVEELFVAQNEDLVLEVRVSRVVEYLFGLALRQKGLIRTLVLRNNRDPDSIPEPIRVSANRILGSVYGFLLESQAQISHSNPATAIEVGLLMIVAAIRERVVLVGATQASTMKLSHEELSLELQLALLSYLRGGGS